MSATNGRGIGPAAYTHPAPHRHRFSGWSIAVGVVAAPLIWAVQLLVDVAMTGYRCSARHATPNIADLAAVPTTLLIVNGMAIVLCAFAATVASRGWSATRDERPGSAHHLVESGDGRTRFLALAGLMASTLFAAAIVFESISVFVVPVCSP